VEEQDIFPNFAGKPESRSAKTESFRVRPRQKAEISGNEKGPLDRKSADGPLCTTGCISENKHDRLEWEVDISKTGKLNFLVDTGADISLITSTKLLGDAVSDPNRKIRVRGVDGSIVQMYGVIQVGIQENFRGRFPLHVVSKQIDFVHDGVLASYFLQSTKAKICYEAIKITLKARKPRFHISHPYVSSGGPL
jgi:hypothetical protein